MRYLDKIKENALWGISNIITVSIKYREKLLDTYRICLILRDSFTLAKEVFIEYL